MQCIELFAGAGGAALGLESAGIHHAALCEWDPSACATMRAAGLGPVVEGDVRDLDAIEAVAGPGPIDLLWSSFPCQAFSTAGKRLGASDERNGWPWTVDAIDRFRPRWLLGENVRGLLCHSSEGHPDPMRCPRCYLDGVIMPQLRERFAHAGYWLLDAADYGVPQHRRRIILWAGPAPLRAPPATHADPATLAQASMFGPRLLPWVSMGEALGLGRTTAYNGQKKAVGPRPGKGPDGKRPPGRFVEATFDTSDPAPTLPTGSGALQVRYIGGGRNPTSDPNDKRTYRDLTDEPSTTIAAVQIGNAGPFVVVAAGETGEGRHIITHGGDPYDPARPSPTVIGHWGKDGDRSNQALRILTEPSRAVTCSEVKGSGANANPEKHQRASDALFLATGRRRLTVEECARLQDFPADHPWQGTKTARYRQVGNAVPPTLARVVAEVVLQADRLR